MGGRFAGEVAGVELREGGVEVVEVEHDARHDPSVGVDLDDAEQLGVETPRAAGRTSSTDTRASRSPRVAMASDVRLATPTSAVACMLAISASRPCRIPAFTTRRRSSPQWSSASVSASASQSRATKVRANALVCARCRVFQPRRRSAELVESRERGVEVCLVEDFAAADQVAFDRQDVDRPATRRRSPRVSSRAHAG